MKIIKGGICAVKEVKAAGVKKGKYGLTIILNKNSNAAGVFTSNKVVAAPVKITKNALKNGVISAVVANSGNANCFTGKQGLLDAEEMSKKVGNALNINSNDIGVGSTGVIGRAMPMDIIKTLIEESLNSLENSSEASKNAAKSIMTTDTFFKELAVETKLNNGDTVKIGGIAKGSGMIAPNMGTMLCYITTDVQASPLELQNALQKAVDSSFNMVVVDGDESTNDMVLIMANGTSGKIDDNFQEALNFLCHELAKMIARDGEGASKFMEVEIKNACSVDEARDAAKSVVKSPLVKTALFGADPNWGRIVAAVGYSGVEMDEDIVSVILESSDQTVTIVNKGIVKAFENTRELEIAEKIMKNKEIKIIVDLALDKYSATAYGCDLSYDYVKINAEYTT